MTKKILVASRAVHDISCSNDGKYCKANCPHIGYDPDCGSYCDLFDIPIKRLSNNKKGTTNSRSKRIRCDSCLSSKIVDGSRPPTVFIVGEPRPVIQVDSVDEIIGGLNPDDVLVAVNMKEVV